MEVRQFERRQATFQPTRTDNLRHGAEAWIGEEAEWEAVWVIDDGESYAGQWAWAIQLDADDPRYPPPFVWVPQCDLRFVPPASNQDENE